VCYRRGGPAPERRAAAGSDVAAERRATAGSDVAAERDRNARRGGGAGRARTPVPDDCADGADCAGEPGERLELGERGNGGEQPGRRDAAPVRSGPPSAPEAP
jgi:hypothetical protein